MIFAPEFRYDTASASDKENINTLDAWAFPNTLSPTQIDGLPFPLDFDRTGLVKCEDQVIGIHSSYEFSQYPVPGNNLRVAGLTWVGVHPQFRRRGILRGMIQQHFADCQTRGEAVSALFAAEPTIYGRFGYEAASFDLRTTIPRGAGLKPVPGSEQLSVRIETRARQTHAHIINSVHRQAGDNVGGTGLNRPGWVGRDTPELQEVWHNESDPVGGREPQRIIIIEQAQTPVAYATFTRTSERRPTGPRGTVHVTEAVALTAAAAHRLWSVLLDLDLTTEVKPFLMATDDPVLNLLENNRQISQTLVDNTWVRIIDLPAALAGRQYGSDVDVILDITDPMIKENSGRWHIQGPSFGGPSGTEQATVTRTTEPAHISLNIRELSAVYLGGQSLAALASAGLVTAHDKLSLAQASGSFMWPHAPVSNWIF